MNLDDGTTSYNFAQLPEKISMIRPYKPNATRRTMTDVAYFAWAATIIGQTVILTWTAMPAAMFVQLDAFFAASLPLIWDPTATATPATTTYNVEMTALDGEYLLKGYDTASGAWRGDVTMTLLILSEV